MTRAVNASTQPALVWATAGAHVNPGSAHSGNRGSALATTTTTPSFPGPWAPGHDGHVAGGVVGAE